VGNFVGNGVGLAEGIDVGSLDGRRLGLAEGAGLGILVLRIVGLSVGWEDVTGVGWAVAKIVGDRVALT
jgi:hypothetical protein